MRVECGYVDAKYRFVVGTYLPWRLQALACGIIPLVFHALMFFVPESPRYLIGKGKRDEALKALCWFRGASSPSEVEGELALVSATTTTFPVVIRQ